MKFRTTLLIEFVVLVGRMKYCMIWVGIEARTDLARVTQSAKDRVLDFQLLNFFDKFARMD